MKNFLRTSVRNVLILFLVYNASLLQAQDWQQISKVVAGSRKSADQFGRSVSISGNYAIVGGKGQSGAAPGAAGAYIYYNDAGSWIRLKALTSPNDEVNTGFGREVSISGNYAIVGVPNEATNGGSPISNVGAAYIYGRDEGGTDNWGLVTKLTGSVPFASELFGSGVSISGNYAIVGASGHRLDAAGDNSMVDAGAAYIFERNTSTNEWTMVKKVVAPVRQTSSYFGETVAIDGDLAIVGARLEDYISSSTLSNAGAAYIFGRNEGNWGTVTKLIPTDPQFEANFGCAVSISANKVIVGSFGADDGKGVAYIFQQNSSDPEIWDMVKRIAHSGSLEGDFFGNSVSIRGDKVIVGARFVTLDAAGENSLDGAGAAFLFGKDYLSPNNWGLLKKVVASQREGEDLFGTSVAIGENYAIVGSVNDQEDEDEENSISSAGSAYIFGDMTALPVTLESFQVTKNENEALLRWATSAETNTDYFEIQRSTNGKNWLILGKVASAKESSGLLSYHFTDSDPKAGQNLYRLKMVDRDGTFAYSRIQNLSFVENLMLNTYPNPAANTLYFKSAGVKPINSVQISDMTGHTVLTANVISEQGISIASLVPGMYLIRINQANESPVYKKLLVAK